jgi:Fe-S oxidoreductase
MRDNRENSLCCGGGAGLKTNNPELADKIAKKRIEQAKAVKVDKIVTTCPLCFAHLEENSDIQVFEFSHVVGDALGISPAKTCSKEIKEEEKEYGEMSN